MALAEAQQFEGFNRLSAFVIHDLKNLIAQLTLVPDADDDVFLTAPGGPYTVTVDVGD